MASTPPFDTTRAVRRVLNLGQSALWRNSTGELAESEFHHPVSINFGWGLCAIVLQTKKIKGLHENDFIMAAKINEIAADMGAGE